MVVEQNFKIINYIFYFFILLNVVVYFFKEMSSGNSTNSKPQTSTGKAESKGEIQFTAELEEILKRITEIKNIAGGLNFINILCAPFLYER